MLLAKLVRKALLPLSVEESANVHLVATGAGTLDALIFVWVVETLDGSVALGAFEAALAVFPSHAVLKRLAILWGVLEHVWRSAEISCMMRVDATL